MHLADRLLTILVTATVTSAAWVVAGGSLIERASGGIRTEGPTAATPSATSPSVPPASPLPGSSGAAITAGGALLIPVAGVAASQLSDTYSDERAGGERLHEAIDIMAPRGTAVVAAAPGTIERLFQSKAGGNTIYLRSTDRGMIHYYAHLDGYAPGLREGQTVARGERLGTVGSTGNADASAPHLHFAILRIAPDADWWEPATAINPYPLLTAR